MRVKLSGNTDFHEHVGKELRKAGIALGSRWVHYEIKLTEAQDCGSIIIACNGKTSLLTTLLWNFQEVIDNFGRVEIVFTESDKQIEIMIQPDNERQMEAVTKALTRALQQTSVRTRWF